MPLGPRQGDHVGEVDLAPGVIGRGAVEKGKQKRPGYRHHARIAEPDRPFLVGGVAIFDDGLDPAAFTQFQPAVFAGIGGAEAQHRDGHVAIGVAVDRAGHRFEGLGANEWRIAEQHQDTALEASQRGPRRLDGVAGAQGRFLHHRRHRRDRCRQIRHARTDDAHQPLR